MPEAWRAYTTPFVGRVAELDLLDEAIAARRRLVTVVGPGGMGKTRLAAEVTTRARGLFVDVSQAQTAQGVVGAVAGRLLGAAGSSVGELARALQHARPPVVVLDNVEQVFEALPETLGAWIRTTPHTTWIATSRRALSLPDEEVLALEPLEPGPAVQLFSEARPAQLRVPLDPGGVRELVQLLDAMPLALEIAAARLSVMSLDDLLARLRTELAVLSDPLGRRPARHRTLETTIAWSWDLLDDWQQDALAQASVFAGAFDLEAAEAVLQLGGRQVLDAIQSLAAHSLLQVRVEMLPCSPAPQDPAPEARADPVQRISYRLWSTTRRFARGRLSPADREAVEQRHGQWAIRASIDQIRASRRRDPRPTRHLGVSPDSDLEQALVRAIARGDRATALGAIPYAQITLGARSELRRLEELICAALDMPGDEYDRGVCLRCYAKLLPALHKAEVAKAIAHRLLAHPHPKSVASGHLLLGHYAVGEAARPHLEVAAGSSTEQERIEALLELAYLDCHTDPDAAVARCAEAVALARAHLYPQNVSSALHDLAVMLQRAGRLSEAIDACREALAVDETLGNLRGQCVSGLTLAEYLIRAGALDRGRAGLEQGIERCRQIGFLQGFAIGTVVRAVAQAMADDPETPRSAEDAEAQLRHIRRPDNELILLSFLAVVWARHEPRRARALLDRAHALLVAQPELRLGDGTPGHRVWALSNALVGAAAPTSRAALREAGEAVRSAAAQPDAGYGVGVLVAFARVLAGRLPEQEPYLVASDGAWFEPPSGPRIALDHRPAPRGVLGALVEGHEVGEALTREALFAAGWPGESILPRAAASRVRVALSQLRKAGLDVIVRADGGWVLDPEAPLWIVVP